jgi:tRNA(Leu) C34 or U34 (ribose-2'-O)-methylase TrmL
MNTGTIARTCAFTGASCLIPARFDIIDRAVKRAGLGLRITGSLVYETGRLSRRKRRRELYLATTKRPLLR